ncbi:hypothetical protein AM587_10001901 [Phytophthora nicotianae]|uniref:Uncharacterized protein n=1 Tax=Phytophthora nicotianae TaxID=4792 RepID=A0A0W8CLB8_PHYNI|nr:hypothetical protein AM587_10001901 [Phytophthora nicotianae]
MESVVDFKVVWPLLRKEGWTWKPAKGLQIHANYLKPGCKLRGGKHEVDYFNGEDAFLAHEKADKDLCTGLHLTNIMVRPNAVPLESLPTSVSSVPSTSGKRQEPTVEKQPPKKLAKTVGSRKSEDKKSEKKQTPNTKKTKKQEAKEATERRRQLSSFGNNWVLLMLKSVENMDRDGIRTSNDEVESFQFPIERNLVNATKAIYTAKVLHNYVINKRMTTDNDYCIFDETIRPLRIPSRTRKFNDVANLMCNMSSDLRVDEGAAI